MVNGTLILKMIFSKLFYALQDSTQKLMRTGINYKCNLNMEKKLLSIILNWTFIALSTGRPGKKKTGQRRTAPWEKFQP